MAKALANITDNELLRLMLAGDADAFEELYDRKQQNIYRFALRMSGSESMAEDVTQEVFMALMRDGGQYDETRGTLSTYLYAIARYRVLRLLERNKMFVSIHDEDSDDYDDSVMNHRFVTDEDPLAYLTQDEIVENVRQAVLALPAHYREVVVLCNLQEMKYEEAADIIGCAVGTVRSRLNRARSMLFEKLRTMKESNEVAQATFTKRYAV
jgi:RNA polymerase sigma-70 factor (ECF subfamily)